MAGSRTTAAVTEVSSPEGGTVPGARTLGSPKLCRHQREARAVGNSVPCPKAAFSYKPHLFTPR